MSDDLIDFKDLGFTYLKTDYNIRYTFSSGKWDSGLLTDDENLNIHIAASALHYGQSVFEGMKVFQTQKGEIVAFRPYENYLRMKRSAEKLYMAPVTENVFFDALNKVVKANKRFIPPYGYGASLYIRPLLIGLSARIGVRPADDYLFMILVTPVGPYFKSGFNPVKLLVVEDLDRAAPFGIGDIKAAGNYAAGLRGSIRAKENGYTDVIYLDAVHRKFIDESGPANFIAILHDGTYLTPSSSSILESITNMSLRTIAEEDFGWKVVKRPVSIDEVDSFAEAGCCGTAAVITPVGSITYKEKEYRFHDEGKTAGPQISKLYKQLVNIQLNEIEDKRDWLYKIKI